VHSTLARSEGEGNYKWNVGRLKGGPPGGKKAASQRGNVLSEKCLYDRGERLGRFTSMACAAGMPSKDALGKDTPLFRYPKREGGVGNGGGKGLERPRKKRPRD